jgi:hypothetical protein
MVGNGDLYLVTGVTKSSSWSVAALENQSGDGKVSLKLKAAQAAAAGVSCAWEWESTSSSFNSGPRSPPGQEAFQGNLNQTVFVRGFKVALRSTPLRRSPKLLSIANSKWSDVTSKSSFVPFSKSRHAGPGSMKDLPPRRPSNTPSADGTSDDEESLDFIPNVSGGQSWLYRTPEFLGSWLTRRMLSMNISLIA